MMKIVSRVARLLLGLMFVVFGANGFLHFIKQPPPINPLAIHFFTAVAESKYAYMFFAFQLISGIALITGFFVPLALMILAAELVNILTYHLTMDPAGILPGLVASILWVLACAQYRGSLIPILRAKPVPE